MKAFCALRALSVLILVVSVGLTLGCGDGAGNGSGTEPDSGIDAGAQRDTDEDAGLTLDAGTDTDTHTETDTDTVTETDTGFRDDWYPELDTDKGESLQGDVWTIIWYQDADNSLEATMLDDVNEAEEASIPDNVNIIVLLDRAEALDRTDGDWTGAKLFKLAHDEVAKQINSPRLADPDFLMLTDSSDNGEELDMGDRETLEKFIEFSKASYPADHYILHISDHGNGWRGIGQGQESSDTWRGISLDDSPTPGSYLTLSEDLPAALEGKGIEAITFDACTMGTVEVAWALAPHADFFGASVSNVPGDGFAYKQTFDSWFQHMSAKNWVLVAIEEFRNYYEGQKYMGFTAVDLGRVRQLGPAVDTLVEELRGIPVEILRPIRDETFRPNKMLGGSMRDLVEFTLRTEGLVGTELVDELLLLYEDVIINYWYSKNISSTRGLTIYFPGKSLLEGGPYIELYEETPFALETRWDELVWRLL